MKYNTVSSLCEGVAGAIRRKEGSTEKINPQDFVQRIDNLQVGGGTSESTVEYVSTEGKNLFEWGEVLGIISFLVKMPTGVVPVVLQLTMSGGLNDALAFALDPTMEFDWQGTRMTIADFCASMGVDLSTYNRLTKEQFYSLE